MKLEPITDETNIKGNEAYVKVLLDGRTTDSGHPLFIMTYENCVGGLTKEIDVAIKSNVFIPIEKPKYDPYRKFKKNDFMRIVPHSRCELRYGTMDSIYKVIEDELPDGTVLFFDDKGEKCFAPSVFFELVKPVEEMETEMPYSIEKIHYGLRVVRQDAVPYFFSYSEFGDKTQEIAEQLCDKLNAVHVMNSSKNKQA